MKNLKTFFLGIVFCAVFCIPLFSEGNFQAEDQGKVVIKLASIAPEATPWGRALNKMASDWSQATNGEVILRVFHNGVAGNESDVLRLLKLNQIQAAVLTTLGINSIAPEAITLSCPFLIRNDNELDIVLKQLEPDLERSIISKGFYPISWNKAGWIRFFARNPVRVPADLKKQKLATGQDEPALTNTFKSMGYQMIPLGLNDTIIALNAGSLDAVFQSPIAAAPLQIFGVAKNMSSFKISPFLGAIVMNQAGWNAIPEKYRDKLMQMSKAVGPGLDASITKLEGDAIKTMQANGLNVIDSTPAQMQEWYNDLDKAIPALLANKTFDATMYNKIKDILAKVRNK
ncbi:MAG: TRAP transporter substrate-binding protein DctP [Spirochaetaceae bacterium]|jgi:TRAP-type C4-dicarboxylate transport system substrate-binding protein|nr:TRAP transporter substrate-binding protein DctP [Spirochaetaceae bacterium]